MKNQLIAASLLTIASIGSAIAGPADYDLQNRTPFQGSLTRAEVQAQAIAAVRNGSALQAGEAYGYTVQAQAPASTRSRAEVRAEALQAARSHTAQEMM